MLHCSIQKEFRLAVNRFSLVGGLVPASAGGTKAQTSEPPLAEVRYDVEGALSDNPSVTDRTGLAPRSLIKVPRLRADNVSDLHQNLADLVKGVIETNLRTTQEMLRVTNHEEFVALQQRFMRDYMAALMHGSVQLIDAIQRAAGLTAPA
jgi:hypothetical protein